MKPDEVNTSRVTTERFAALSRVGAALMSELDETRLLQLIAETACELTGAQFAAFSIRPTDEAGQPLVPADGKLFHLAAVVGVTKEQEALFRRMPLGGEGLLAPIFRHGVSVLVPDVLVHVASATDIPATDEREMARKAASAFVHGQVPVEELRSMGIPRGHPVVRSFLGAPLLNRERQVRGGLLLGHAQPNRFTPADEALLVGLATQAAVALENAQLYQTMQMRAQELNAIFENIADGIILVDRQERVLRENKAAQYIRALLRDHAEGSQYLEDLLSVPARSALQDQAVQDQTVVVSGEYGEGKEYVVTASPLRLPAVSSGPLAQSGDTRNQGEQTISGAVIVWHDVTERRIREQERVAREIEREAHAEAEARLSVLQMILDELPSSVYLVQGQDARLVLANRATAAIWGAAWPHDQPLTAFLEEQHIHIFGIDGRALTSSQLATLRAVQERKHVYQQQESICHPDGTIVPVLVNAVALDAQHFLRAAKTSQTTPEPMAIVVHQDVTALKETEQLKDEFIALAAHELRTPLAILKGFVQTLLVQTARGKGPVLAEWQTESLQEIEQATNRLVELTEDLLNVTRMQAGRLKLQTEAVDLPPLLQRLVAQVQMTTEHHQLSIHATLSHLVVRGDPRRIEQVLNNLLQNAIKYSPAGGSIEVRIYLDESTKMALLSIKDQGIGIPTQQQSRIFSRFARANNAQTYGIGGTGLGLYLCRELVERQNGRIWFESVEEVGSTFFLTFPLFSDTSCS